MKITLGFAAIALVFASAIYVVKPVQFQTFLLPKQLKSGWVFIEYDNPKCPALSGRVKREFAIPESGYLCTSSAPEYGRVIQRFYLVEEGGKLTELKKNTLIFQFHRFELTTSGGVTRCAVTTDAFWYGPRDEINFDQKAEIVTRKHPECR